MGLDRRVWMVMGLTSILSLALLGFKQLGNRNCMTAAIVVDGKLETGISVRNGDKPVLFRLSPYATKKVTWSFDDGTGKKEGPSLMHRFEKEGTYRVVARVEGGCTYEQVVTIQKPLFTNLKALSVIEIFEDPRMPKAGTAVNFYGITNRQARSYEWKLLDSPDSVQYGSVTSFTFPYPGTYKIQLRLDNDPARTIIKAITVTTNLPAGGDPTSIPGGGFDGGMPPGSFPNAGNNPFEAGGGLNPPGTGTMPSDKPIPATAETKPSKEEPERAVAVDPNTFQAILQEVIAGSQELDALYRYLDYKSSTKVQVMGKPEVMNIGPFCRQMMDNKNRKIETLEFVKDANNSIQTIKVKVSEQRGFLGRLFGKN